MTQRLCFIGRPAAIVAVAAAIIAADAAYAGDKVTICHTPPGNPGNAHTIAVDANAWPAHEAHGDSTGECAAPSGGGSESSGAGPSGGNAFVVVLCDGRRDESGRSIEVSETGRATIAQAECE